MLLGLCYVLITKIFTEFATVGIGVHHAGVSIDDRRATEQLYLKKVLRILVATSVRNYIFYQFPESVHDILSRRWLLALTCVRSKVDLRLSFKYLTPSSGPHGCHQGCADFPEWEKSRIFRPRYHADVRSCGKAYPNQAFIDLDD